MTIIQTWFTQGFLHPLLTPSHIILLVSLAVLIGQQGNRLYYSLLLLISGVVGVVLNQNLSLNLQIELILLALALIVSLLVVVKVRLPTFLLIVLIIISGIVIAFDSDPILIPGVGANSINNWLFGAVVSMTGVFVLIALIATFLRQFWEGIILRILGSWIATSAIFILTLSFSKGLT